MMKRFVVRAIVLVIALGSIPGQLIFSPAMAATATVEPATQPAGEAAQYADIRLAVIIVVDQFRGDLISRFYPYFGEDGFKRLIKRGAFFPNAYYSYGPNSTAVGHATIATGRLPRRHGIINNEWYLDPQSTHAQHVVLDKDVQAIGLAAGEKAAGYSPRYLIGPTLGDEMKLADRRSRVFSISLKPRAAIMLGGQNPDHVFWWDRTAGKFLTSTWYGKELPPYVADYDEHHWTDRFIGQTWEKLLPDAAYAGCYPTDASWIHYDYGVGPAFPHHLVKQASKPPAKPYDAVYGSPYGNEVLLELARRVFGGENIGRGPARDLFCVSLSANDIVGHVFGPQSAEYMDMTIRTDRQIASLLKLLDEQVGLDHCAVVLTGDHGIKAVPQLAEQVRLGGRHLDTAKIATDLNQHLTQQFGQLEQSRSYVLGIRPPWLWFDHSFSQWNLERQLQVMSAATEYLSQAPGIAAVFTAAELEEAPPPADDTARWLAWRSYCPGRSGQIYVDLEPFWYETDEENNTGHGSGHSEDRHVPILLAAPGIRPGRHMQTVDPLDIAPTLAAILGIEPPNDFAGRVLSEAFEK